jgi:hypothetical protein
MSELSPEARALVDDGHSVLRPSSRDRARVASALATRIGAAALVLPKPAIAQARLPMWSLRGVATVVAGVGAGFVAIGMIAQPSAVSGPPVKPPPVATSTLKVGPAPTSSATISPAPLDTTTAERTLASPRKLALTDPLAEEVAILSKATSALRAGNPSEGLRLLEEHQRKFPNGRLAEERRAARIQALCALGRRAAAEAELAQLARSSPRSPHLARAQRACGMAP